MAVHVSIHDVTPAWNDAFEDALRACHERGLKPALLVVPRYHHGEPITSMPAFCERLVALQKTGHPVYLHGFYHQSRPAPPAQGTHPAAKLAWHFAQTVVSAGEAEFMDVTPEEAELRLEEGHRILTEAGLRVEGFVPPAWAMKPWLLALLARRGYRHTEDHTHTYDPVAGTRTFNVVLNYASRTPGRLLASVAYCRGAQWAGRFFPTRIALHPADMNYLLLRRETHRLLDWARERGPSPAFVHST